MDNAGDAANIPGMTERTDVIIVGAGLIGPAAALALAGIGLSSVLLDAAPEEVRRDPEFDGRAYAVALGSERLLDLLGAWQAAAPHAQEIAGIEVSDAVRPGRAAPALLHFDPAETGPSRIGTIVEDRHLRAALMDRMAAEERITRLAPVRVARVDYGPGGAEVRLEDGRALAAPLVLAADGRGSETARQAGIRRIGWRYGQTGMVAAIEHERPHHGIAHQTFFAGGPFAMLPLTGNRTSLVWSDRTAEAERMAALSDADYEAEIALRVGGRLGAVKLAGRRWAYPLDLTLAVSYAAPRLALVGDAAHGVHPIAGQGMNMGLRDVAALTEVLAGARRIGEDIGALDVLERYQRWRRFDATASALGMDALNRLFSADLGPLNLVRDAGLRLVDRLGAARRGFTAEATGQAGDVPRLLAGEWP